MAHILVIRFSALGDVAMTVPVLYSVAKHYPMHEFTFLSKDNHAPLFEHMPKNVHFRGVNLQYYRGLTGLLELFHQLEKEHYDAVADLHDVLRSKVLRWAFKLKGVPEAHILKNRRARKALVRRENKVFQPLRSSQERYADVLANLKCPVDIDFRSIFGDELPALPEEVKAVTGTHKDKTWVGVAPFARHEGKIYPLPLMRKVLEELGSNPDIKLFLFGFGEKERAWSEQCEWKLPGVTSLVGKFDMGRELVLMSHLDVMLTMDSANMHLASLVNVPTVSVWGATHPYAGFGGFQVKGSEMVQLPMECRPCSVYGKAPCYKGTGECMAKIPPTMVVDAVLKFYKKEKE